MQAKDIEEKKNQLRSTIDRAKELKATKLAKRLEMFYRWIDKYKVGKLTKKDDVMKLIEQLIKDSEIWLDLKEGKIFSGALTPLERYWYMELFSRWFKRYDEKINGNKEKGIKGWKGKLMSGEFKQEDGDVLEGIKKEIEREPPKGEMLYRLIADLSMATDLIVSGKKENAICAQITQSDQEYTGEKEEDWQKTLDYWNIDRGTFVNYNPGEDDYISKLATVIVQDSDTCPPGEYRKHPKRQSEEIRDEQRNDNI